MFAVPKRLGTSGLEWLKIHVASIFGHDKKPFDERLEWTNNQMSMIQRIADDPLNPETMPFWVSTEKPWQVGRVQQSSEMSAGFGELYGAQLCNCNSRPKQLPL